MQRLDRPPNSHSITIVSGTGWREYAKGASLLHDGQDDANVRQDYPIEIDESLPGALVEQVRKRRMEDQSAAEEPSVRRKLCQNPPKMDQLGLVRWAGVLSRSDVTDFEHGPFDRVKVLWRKDDQARLKELKHVRKEIQSMRTRLDDLWNKVTFFKEQEEDAQEQKDAL